MRGKDAAFQVWQGLPEGIRQPKLMCGDMTLYHHDITVQGVETDLLRLGYEMCD